MSRQDRIEDRLRETRRGFGRSARQIALEFDGGWRAESFTEREVQDYEFSSRHGLLGTSARDTADRIERNLRSEEFLKEEHEREEALAARRKAERRLAEQRRLEDEEAYWAAERERDEEQEVDE